MSVFVNAIIFLSNLSNLSFPRLSWKLVLNSALFVLIWVENWFPVQPIHFLCEQTNKYSCGSAQNHKSSVFDLFNHSSHWHLCYGLICVKMYIINWYAWNINLFKNSLWSAVALYYWSLRIKFRKQPHALASHKFLCAFRCSIMVTPQWMMDDV